MSGIDEKIKEDICAAFCSELAVHRVPAGLAVSTNFQSVDGDPIGFYVIRNSGNTNEFRLEDSGTLVPLLEADGVNLKTGTRADLFKSLLTEYGAEFDTGERTLHTPYMTADKLASNSLRFMALMLRIQDLEMLHPSTVQNTFAEDAKKALASKFKEKAAIEFGGIVSDSLTSYMVDAIVRPDNLSPVAVYFATHQSRVDEAVILRMEATQKHENLKVVLLLETAKPNIPSRSLTRAHNMLDGMPVFESRTESMDKIYATAFHNGVTH